MDYTLNYLSLTQDGSDLLATFLEEQGMPNAEIDSIDITQGSFVCISFKDATAKLFLNSQYVLYVGAPSVV